MTEPRVTAVIIVLNGERFITEAIESVQAQTLEDWELLVADDGSSDGTRDIVGRMASLDPRIRLIRHPDGGNHGMSATRNLGIGMARAEFLAFLDADDVWMPTKLAEQVALMDEYPGAAMVYGKTLIWHSWEEEASKQDYFYDLGVNANRVHRSPILFHQLLRGQHQSPTTCNALMRTEAVRELGGFDSTFRDMFEDQIFFAKLLLRFPVYVSGRCWAKYRQRSDATCSLFEVDRKRLHDAKLRYLRTLRSHLRRVESSLSPPRMSLEAIIAAEHARSVARFSRNSVKRMLGR